MKGEADQFSTVAMPSNFVSEVCVCVGTQSTIVGVEETGNPAHVLLFPECYIKGRKGEEEKERGKQTLPI